MADMLSRARFDDEGGMVSEDEEVGVDFFEAAYVTTKGGLGLIDPLMQSRSLLAKMVVRCLRLLRLSLWLRHLRLTASGPVFFQ